jgi:hypothetical protein
LALVEVLPGKWLLPAPAATVQRAFAAGCPREITSAYRSPEEQQALRDAYLKDPKNRPYAAPVNLSRHCVGDAVDWGRNAANWHRANPSYGMRFTDSNEWWHTQYFQTLDLHTAEIPPVVVTPPTTETDDDMPWFYRRKDGAIMFVGPQGPTPVTAADWSFYTNMGWAKFGPGLDNMDEGPFNVLTNDLIGDSERRIVAGVLAGLPEGSVTADQIVDAIKARL